MLVPSLRPQRPRLDAFSTALVLRRDDRGWRAATADTPYYLYSAHVSGAWLEGPTLAVSLYLLLLRLLARDFPSAFPLADDLAATDGDASQGFCYSRNSLRTEARSPGQSCFDLPFPRQSGASPSALSSPEISESR